MLKEALELSEKSNVIIPTTVVTAKMKEHEGSVKYIDQVEEDESIFDIAPESFREYQDLFDAAGTILWNGPIGLFEENAFSKGTIQVAKMIVSSKGFSVAGGGDTISAASKAGVLDKLDYVSTAGGAFLEFIEGRKLPSLEALQSKLVK
jgi:phosphoglycerate kinase